MNGAGLVGPSPFGSPMGPISPPEEPQQNCCCSDTCLKVHTVFASIFFWTVAGANAGVFAGGGVPGLVLGAIAGMALGLIVAVVLMLTCLGPRTTAHKANDAAAGILQANGNAQGAVGA